MQSNVVVLGRSLAVVVGLYSYFGVLFQFGGRAIGTDFFSTILRRYTDRLYFFTHVSFFL